MRILYFRLIVRHFCCGCWADSVAQHPFTSHFFLLMWRLCWSVLWHLFVGFSSLGSFLFHFFRRFLSFLCTLFLCRSVAYLSFFSFHALLFRAFAVSFSLFLALSSHRQRTRETKRKRGRMKEKETKNTRWRKRDGEMAKKRKEKEGKKKTEKMKVKKGKRAKRSCCCSCGASY